MKKKMDSDNKNTEKENKAENVNNDKEEKVKKVEKVDNETNELKKGFFKKVWYSIYKIEKYSELNLIKLQVQEQNKKIVEPEFQKIYDILSYEESIHINEITQKLNLSISEVNEKLMMLELEEKVVSLPGNNYKKC